jgi:hypothetical protein
VLADQRVGIEIAKALVHDGRTLEIREQQCHLSNPETLGLVDTIRPEKAAKSLSGEQLTPAQALPSGLGLRAANFLEAMNPACFQSFQLR